MATLAAGLSLSVHADAPIFGNSPGDGTGFSLVAYNSLSMSGGAVGFTPQNNFDVSSVTLWLSGYTGQFGQKVDVSIWGSYNNAPSTPLFYFGSATPNNGSLAAFTFSDPTANPFDDPSGITAISANTEYWLVATAQGAPGDYIEGANWVGGSTPSGSLQFDGADNYDVYGGSFSPSSALPAFALNDSSVESAAAAAPEPGVISLMSLPLLLWSLRALARARRAPRLAPIAKTLNRTSCPPRLLSRLPGN